MTWPLYPDAPADIRKQIERARRDCDYPLSPGSTSCAHVRAVGQLEAMRLCTRLGYAWPASLVETPFSDELRRLEEVGDLSDICEHRRDYDLELQFERKCLLRAQAMKPLEDGPSLREQAEQRVAEEQARQQAIEARTAEIAEQNEAAARAERLRRARLAAEREMSR